MNDDRDKDDSGQDPDLNERYVFKMKDIGKQKTHIERSFRISRCMNTIRQKMTQKMIVKQFIT